jgi:hypothetical protein
MHSRRHPIGRTVALAFTLLALSACAGGTSTTSSGATTAAPTTTGPAATPTNSADQRYQVDATVLANAGHGPQACQSVLDSLPPQCGGLPLHGFAWSQLPPTAVHRAGPVTWAGGVHLVGTFDGTTLSLTRPASLAPAHEVGSGERGAASSFETPCAPPAGGWRIVDPTKVGLDDWNALDAYVTGQPDYSTSWIDASSHVQGATGQPAGNVFTAAFTGDAATHHRAMAAMWGGAVCVVTRPHSQADLVRVQAQIFSAAARRAGVKALSGGTTVSHGRAVLTVTVLVATPQVEAWIRRRAGTVPVHIDGWLAPVAR